MNRERIAKMTDSIVAAATAEPIDNTPITPVADDEAPLAMVEQAMDTMIAAMEVIDEYLPKVKTEGVPQQAAVDAVKDLMDTAVKPYMADVVTAMRVFGD